MRMQGHGNVPPTKDVLVLKWQTRLVSQLVDLGARVTVLVDRRDPEPPTDVRAGVERIYEIGSFDSLDEIAAVAADLLTAEATFDVVISHQEVTQIAAGYLETLLGVGDDPLYRLSLRDKRLTKQRLNRGGLPVARWASLRSLDDEQGLNDAATRLIAPYVAKPAAGFGTMSTLRLSSASELLDLKNTFHFEPLIRSRQLIVEEFVSGDELQIEMFWSAGELIHFVAFKYHVQRIRMMPLDQHQDGVRLILRDDDPVWYDHLRGLCEMAGRAMSITDGTSQVEAFVDADGTVTISEIAARGGGAWTPALMNQYLGYPLWDLIARCHLRLPIREPRRSHRYLASISIRPSERGQVTGFPSAEDYDALPGVLSWDVVRNIGDRARLHHPSDYYVHVIVGADTPAELQDRCAQAQRTLKVTVEPNPKHQPPDLDPDRIRKDHAHAH